jgi:predicted esterase
MSDPHAGQRVLGAGAPLGLGAAAVILVHGRGASPEDILGLASEFERPSLTYLAPAAGGGSWYPFSFLTDMTRNEPGLSSALGVIARLVQDLVGRGVPTHRIVLGGFSQGACLASEFAVRHARRYGGVLAFSGGLIGPPGTTWDYPGSFQGTPVFLGCSDVDAHIPKARVDETAEVFNRMGAQVTQRIYPGMGHVIVPDEIAAARAILDSLASGPVADRPGET